ncbi:hypothetical protein RND71_018749 [Anisodus tanguticus]|uniref:Uncharacterized protein n=1 Tax=Anisodus tanguticus TaxID=243964 RepID=A0AAE1S4Q0_9SOLA|nr:hypothetical protein RND71_018749 [Anisodus tanguticus]
MSVLAETRPSKMLGKSLHQSVDTRSPPTFKRRKVDTTRNFPENCGPFVRQKDGSRIQSYANAEIYPEFPSTPKHVKVDATRNFPENCGPCVPQKRNGSGTQCSTDVEIKRCSEVAMNVIESAEPLSVFVPSNLNGKPKNLPMVHSLIDATEWEVEAKDMKINLPPIPKEVGYSSHLNTSCQPTNGNQPLKMKQENHMHDESTQQHGVLVNQRLKVPEKASIDTGNRCDWFIKGGPIENGPELPAIVSQDDIIEGQNEPSKDTSKSVQHEKFSDDESRSGVDDDEIYILSRFDWLKSRSASTKDGKGEIIQAEASSPEGAVYFKPDSDQYESVVMMKQIDTGISQEDSRDSVMCGVSSHGLLTEYEHIQKVKEVRETLKLFDDLYTKLLQENKAEKYEGQSNRSSIHIEAAMSLKNQEKWVNCGWRFGHVPGVEIGDQFRFRAELVMIGLHCQFIKGIDYVNINGKYVATSIVDSGRYENEAISSQTFIYVGQGGNPKVYGNARVEDQKLERGNLALKNSMDLGYPVRVICGRQRVNGEKSYIRYIYDGLYTVTNCWQERGPTGKYVFKFELKRNLGQLKLTGELVSRPANLGKVNHFLKNVNKATKSVMQVVHSEFVVDYDLSQGKEKILIPAVNAIDDERPPPFTYITSMQYPDWYHVSRPQGCSCTSGCSDSEQCFCASRNGGEIPFNTRGSITRARTLVYECGPSCKCPPSCKNRVSQRGPRYHLEVFKTESRGWGLRSRDYISMGSFICEYVGELLDEKEAENRIDNDEYLFDIGNYDDEIPKRNTARSKNLKVESTSLKRKDEDGFTLDAVRYGNVGRFINHSCSPNLYAQNAMYDHGDRRAPHIMFFAAEKIAPLEEFTYHYNYQIGHVRDRNGNLKRKNCRCGSRKCEERMY